MQRKGGPRQSHTSAGNLQISGVSRSLHRALVRSGQRGLPELSRLRRPILLFVLRLSLFWAIGMLLLRLVPDVEALNCRFTATILAFILGGFGVGLLPAGGTLQVGASTIGIGPDCTSVLPTLLLWSAILAFPSSLSRKWPGLALSAAALWVLNLLRMLTLIGVLTTSPDLFDLIHVYLWQFATSAAVFGLFIFWATDRLAGRQVAS